MIISRIFSGRRHRTPQESLAHVQRLELAATAKRAKVIELLEGNLDRLAEIKSLIQRASDEDPALQAQVATGKSGIVERTRI